MGVAQQAGSPNAPLKTGEHVQNSMRAKLKRAVRKCGARRPYLSAEPSLRLGLFVASTEIRFLLVPNSVSRGDPYPFTLSAHVVRSGRGAMGDAFGGSGNRQKGPELHPALCFFSSSSQVHPAKSCF